MTNRRHTGNGRRRDRFLEAITFRSRPQPALRTTVQAPSSFPPTNPPPAIALLLPTTPLATSVTVGHDVSLQTPTISAPAAPAAAGRFDLLARALHQLSEDDQTTLQLFISRKPVGINVDLDQCLMAVRQKQESWADQRTILTFAGRSVGLRDQFEKVIKWVGGFKAVGDVVVDVDPLHAGVPWAGIRFLLEVFTSDAKQTAAVLVGCEIVLYMVNRMQAYIVFLSQLSQVSGIARDNFETALASMYAHILMFLARAFRRCQQTTLSRKFHNLWQTTDVQDFEQECDKLGLRLDIEAMSCNRMLATQDRAVLHQLQQDLQRSLTETMQLHILQEKMERIEKRLDLHPLKTVEGAAFDAYDQGHQGCHPSTRTALLQSIKDWVRRPDEKTIFWLNGMAGTGKSTVSWTVARWLADQGDSGAVQLGASFFFKRGEADRGRAALLFPTLANQLAARIPGFDVVLAKALDNEPQICSKTLGEQFEKLISAPLQQLAPTLQSSTYVMVLDGLDECEKDSEIRAVLNLWSTFLAKNDTWIRLFVTSRPETPVRLGFKAMPGSLYQDVILHEVPHSIIRHDIFTYLQDEFANIRAEHNFETSGDLLAHDWPKDQTLQKLTDMAVPLFIVAATICRFVSDADFPHQALQSILDFRSVMHMSQVGRLYLSILRQMAFSWKGKSDEKNCYEEFQIVVGSIVTLAEPLSRTALAALLNISSEIIVTRLKALHSVVLVPADAEGLIRPLHLSFSEHLISDELQSQPFHIDHAATHDMLWKRCLDILTGKNGIREDICQSGNPSQPRDQTDLSLIHAHLPSAMRYACRYWAYHLQNSSHQLSDGDQVHKFLKEHFLHWLEALSLIGLLDEAIVSVRQLQSKTKSENSRNVTKFLEDAQKFINMNRYIIDLVPLQVYASAIIFAPRGSVVREICGNLPIWLPLAPNTPLTWTLERQRLHISGGPVTALSFSSDNSIMASGSQQGLVQLWDSITGQEIFALHGPADIPELAFSTESFGSLLPSPHVQELAFSTDSPSSLLASTSAEGWVYLWKVDTGRQVWKKNMDGNHLAFSFNGKFVAVAQRDIHLLCTITGQLTKSLVGHVGQVSSLVFSHDNVYLASSSHHYSDSTIRVWNTATSQEVWRADTFPDLVLSTVFVQSDSGLQLISMLDSGQWSTWDMQKGQKLRESKISFNRSLSTISQNGLLFAGLSSEGIVYIGDLAAGKVIQDYSLDHALRDPSFRSCRTALSSDGSLFVSSDGGTARLWDLTVIGDSQDTKHHFEPIDNVTFSHDGLLLASASKGHPIRIWSTTTGQRIQSLDGLTDSISMSYLLFSQNKSFLASLDSTLRLWDLSTGQEKWKLVGEFESIYYIKFSPESSILAIAATSQMVQSVFLLDTATGQVLQAITPGNYIRSLTFSSDASLIAVGTIDPILRIYNTATYLTVQEIKLSGLPLWSRSDLMLKHLTFSEDSSLIAILSCVSDRGLKLQVTKLATNEEVWRRAWTRIEDLYSFHEIRNLSFTTDNKAILTNMGTIEFQSDNEGFLIDPSSTLSCWNSWIAYGGQNLLWLPQDYRSSRHAIYGNTVAFGMADGTVAFLRIEPPPVPEPWAVPRPLPASRWLK